MSKHSSPEGFEADVHRLETGLRQLKIQYDMFFAGALKRQPLELRAGLEKIMRRYSEKTSLKYAQRFRFNAIASRYTSLTELWGKTMRSMEEGDRRSVHTTAPVVREQLVGRCRVRDPRNDHQAMSGLYKRFVEARRRAGLDESKITFDRFVRGVSGQTDRLRKKSGCAEIELRVVIRDDDIQLKARPLD